MAFLLVPACVRNLCRLLLPCVFPRFGWKRLFLLGFAAVSLVFLSVSGAAAQPPAAHPITTCVNAHPDTNAYFTADAPRSGSPSADPAASPTGTPGGPNWAQHTRSLMSAFVDCSLEYAAADIVPMVTPWFNWIVVIMVVWTGVTVMFSGSMSLQNVLSFVLLLVFASSLMNVYFSPAPVWNVFGLNQGLPHTVLGGAEMISEQLFLQADEVYYDAFDDAISAVELRSERIAAAREFSAAAFAARVFAFGLPAAVVTELFRTFGSLHYMLWSMSVTALMWTFLAFLHIIYWIIMAQYMWGYFAMAVLSVVGPVFIPLVLIPQTQEYFWGWLKALINSAFYMITSAALYVVIAILLVLPLQSLVSEGATPPTDAGTGLTGLLVFASNLFTQFLPVLVMAFMAALQVGGLANSLTSGSPPPGAGLAGRIRQLGSGGAAVAAARGAVADRYANWKEHRAGVLSSDTRRRRQAVEQAHSALGDGPSSRSTGGPTLRVLPPDVAGQPGPSSAGAGPGAKPPPIVPGGSSTPGGGATPHSRSTGGAGTPALLRSPEFQLFERRIRQATKPAQMAKALDDYKRAVLAGRGGRG